MLTFSCWETRPTDPSFLSKCRSVCHFFIPACPSQVWAMLEMSLITNWGASLLIKLSDSLLTSASRQCQLLLHTKANNDTALYLFLRSEVNRGHGSKRKEHIRYDMIQYNTIPTRAPKLTGGRTVEDSLCKRWTFLILELLTRKTLF